MQPLVPLTKDNGLDWDGSTVLQMPAGIGRLEPRIGPGGLSLSHWRKARIRIRFSVRHRENLRVAGRAHSTSFKNLFQQFAVPTWNRARIPLVYLDGKLAAVGDLCICEPFAGSASEQGVHIHWTH